MTLLVVADNSPLDVLIRLGHSDLLKTLFGEVVIPTQVRDELLHSSTPEITRKFIENPPDWLQVCEPTKIEPIPALHLGERAAISLALEMNAHLLLIDEKRGRYEAMQRQLVVTGTIGILEQAAEKRLIDLADAFASLQKTDFRIAPKILDQRLQLHRVTVRSGKKKKGKGHR